MDFLKAIAKNIKNAHTPISRERAETCNNCKDKSKKIYANFVNSEIKIINGYVCNICKCPIATKIFATEPKNICNKWKS